MRLNLTPPKGWNSLPLSRIITGLRGGVSVNGTDLPAKNGEQGVLKLSAISYGQFAPEQNKAVLENERSRLGPSVRGNTILISRSNTTELVGACVYVPEDFPHLYLSDLIWEIEVNPSDGNSAKWLSYMLSSGAVRASLVARATGTSGSMKKLSMAALRVMEIWQPPLPEQERIAEIIMTWDMAITQTAKLIEAKRKLKKGLMQQLLAGKRRFPGFRSNWKEQRLAELAEFHNGRAFKPEDWGDQGLPIIRIQNLNGSTEFNYYNGPYDKKHLVRDGDLLFSWSGSRGTSFGSFVWQRLDGLLNQHIFKVVPTGQVTQSYLGYLLRYTTNLIEQKAHGSAGLVHITKRELERFPVHFPSDQEEQQKIAAVLYALQTRKSMHSAIYRINSRNKNAA